MPSQMEDTAITLTAVWLLMLLQTAIVILHLPTAGSRGDVVARTRVRQKRPLVAALDGVSVEEVQEMDMQNLPPSPKEVDIQSSNSAPQEVTAAATRSSFRTREQSFDFVLRDAGVGTFRCASSSSSSKSTLEWGRVMTAGAAVGSVLLNVGFVTAEFVRRPVRDSSQHYNLSTIVVAYAECILVHLHLAQFAACLVAIGLGARQWFAPFPLALHFFGQCNRSLLRAISLINPGRALETASTLYNASRTSSRLAERILVVGVSACVFLFMAGLGVVALAVKLAQLRFVIERGGALEWSLAEVLAYAGFVNQVAGVGAVNPLAHVYRLVFDLDGDGEIDSHEQEVMVAFHQDIAAHVVSKHRLWGSLWMLTYSIPDVSRIVVDRRCHHHHHNHDSAHHQQHSREEVDKKYRRQQAAEEDVTTATLTI